MMKRFLMAGTIVVGLATPALAQMGRPQGPVTRDAYLAGQKQRFAAVDANHDGVVTRDELTAMLARRMGNTPPAAMIDAIYTRMDTDGDGKATEAEVSASEMARFDAMDSNHDGTLTPDERQAGMAAMRAPQ